MKKYDYRKIFAVLLCLIALCGLFVGCTGQVTKASYADLDNLELDEKHNPLYYEAYVAFLDGRDPTDELKEEFLKPYVEVKEKDKDGNPSKIVYKPQDLNGDGKVDLLIEKNQYSDVEEKADKGFTYYILSPVGKMRAIVNDFLGRYILSLFVFAVLVKVLLFWFSYKQQKSMVKQAYFKPKERAIRNKYKGRTDQATMQKMNQEIMDAQQKEGVNMFGGCLPMLIQMPIIILLYEVIRNPLLYVAEYSTATINALKNVLFYNGLIENAAITELDMVAVLRDFATSLDFSNVLGMAKHLDGGIIEDLPNFYMIAGKYVDLSFTPTFKVDKPIELLYLLIPVITFAALYFSMKLNRKMTGAATAPASTDENMPDMSMANGVMDLAMPAMSTVITFMVPSVLGVYWIFNNLLSTVQQFILKKMVPFPVFTEEDYKQAE
ncbi:MAG: YidC/Oxa1 family membrane protein insertase, partial [Clostridia bacterium]|nr:YidC/Oxa1 family membrane protein insertase [Clostridia bacterium]